MSDIKYKSTKSGLIILDEPLYKSEYGSNKSYSLIEQFDKGVIPPGWVSSVVGAGSSVAYTQAYESNIIGQAFLQSNQALINNRSGLIFGSTFNYILDYTQCVYTIWRATLRNGTGAMTNIIQVGLGNTITPANVIALAPLTGFGNTIAFRLDPLNKTGENPGLITNWILFTKKAGIGFNAVDTGIPYTPATFQNLAILIDNSVPLTPTVKAFINNDFVAEVPSVDMTKVPMVSPTGAGLGTSPMFFTGSGGYTGGPATTLRVGHTSIYRLNS